MPATKKKTPSKQSTLKKSTDKTRRIKLDNYKSFRLSKQIKHPGAKLHGSFRLLAMAVRHLFKHWRIFTAIIFTYLLLTLIFVKGFAGGIGLTDLKDAVQDALGGSPSNFITGVTLLGVLLGSTGSSQSESGATYQTILLIIFSLVLIWILRQTFAGKKVRFGDGFYKGIYPLIPFLLVLLTIGLQLIPLGVASLLYSIIITGGLAVTALETALWLLLIFLLVLFSLYMLSSSIFALYIVTLPDMTPMKALRSARQLVHLRRWAVLRKVVFLPVALLVLAGIIMLPLVIYATPIAEWTFFVLNMAALAIAHAYLYGLYRELL